MKQTLFAIVALALCLTGATLTACSTSVQENVEDTAAVAEDTPEQPMEFVEIADEPADEDEIFQPIYELAISGHPQYGKAILLANNKEENNAMVSFFDHNGKYLGDLDGEGGWNAQGFLAYFKDDTEIGVMGMGVGPYFTEKGKEYAVKIIEEQ